jgi:hypothetical protein
MSIKYTYFNLTFRAKYYSIFKEFDESLPEIYVFSISFPEIMRIINYAVYQGEIQEGNRELRLSISFTTQQIKDIVEEFKTFSTKENIGLSIQQKKLIKEIKFQMEKHIRREKREEQDIELEGIIQGIGII